MSGSLETPGIPSLGGVVTAVVDVASAKLFVLVDVPSGYQTGGVLRCELDGTNCDFIYLPSNATFDTPGARPVIDDASGQLLVLAHEGLVRCKLDLSSCAFADISAGAGAGALMGMALAIDPIHAKLLVVGEDQSASSDVVLLRCAVDGSNCRETDLSAGISPASPPFVAAPPLVDAADQKLLVPTQTIDAPHAHLLRCDLDGTGCALVDISAGHDGFVGSAIIDPAHQSLLAMTTQCSFRACWPGILHCALDGTGCAYLDVLQSALADDPTPFLDPTSDTLYVIGSGRDSNRVPFEVALWSLGLCW